MQLLTSHQRWDWEREESVWNHVLFPPLLSLSSLSFIPFPRGLQVIVKTAISSYPVAFPGQDNKGNWGLGRLEAVKYCSAVFNKAIFASPGEPSLVVRLPTICKHISIHLYVCLFA